MEDLATIPLHTLKHTSVMKMKFKVYTYITPDHEPGTLIVHPDLTAPFDEQRLFEMDNLVVNEISLQDILEKGFIKFGSTDTMDEMDIEYPIIENDKYPKSRITGIHWDYSQKEVADMIGKEFEVEVSEKPVFDSDSLDMVSEDSNMGEVSDQVEVDRSLDNRIEVTYIPKIEQTDSVLQDEKMDEIMENIDNCRETAIKNIDRLLSELEF